MARPDRGIALPIMRMPTGRSGRPTTECVPATTMFKNYAVSDLMIGRASEKLLAVFAGGFFESAPERSVR